MKKVAFVITLLFFIFVVLTGCGIYDELPPKIKHGEFPFKLKYELNGKIYDINDTVICDFDDFDTSGGFGKFRTWEEHLKSGSERFSIILNENVHSVLEPGRVNKSSEVYFDYGDGSYYMGDPKADSAIHSSPHFCYVETYEKLPKEKHVYATPTLLPTIANYSEKDLIKKTMEIALIKKEIPDYELLKSQGRIILSTENLDPKISPTLPGVDMIMLTPEEIQEKADREGDFLYLRFKKIDIGIINASVSLDNFWIRSKDSTKGYLSGGGFTLNFNNVLGIWIENPVRQSWIS